MHITILGCGPSGGVPLIGCKCSVCVSHNPKNHRRRTSVLVEDKGTKVLIDTSPDLRTQALGNNITQIDGLLYTHAHADHTHGLDELRAFNYHADRPIDTYATQTTFDELIARFPYAFKPKDDRYGWFRPCLVPHNINHGDELKIGNIHIQTFSQTHGGAGETLGFRSGKFAYSTDLNALPDKSFEMLENLDVWIVGCLQREPAPTHAHLELVKQWVKKLKPKKTILTHMSHDFEYESLLKELPESMLPAYDNMTISL